jgi:hypothetical protein
VQRKIPFAIYHFQILSGRIRGQDFEEVGMWVLTAICDKPESERRESTGTLGAPFNEHLFDAVSVKEVE